MQSSNLRLSWQWYKLNDMAPSLLYDMLALREAIFVVEQACIYHELDGRDKQALHLVAVQNEKLIACLRMLPCDNTPQWIRIGRVAVAAQSRGRGIARAMMHKAIHKAQLDFPRATQYLDAQTYLQGFYESLGFMTCGDAFIEDGIAHIPMQITTQENL